MIGTQDAYRGAIARALPRLLGALDREPDSPTHGSFDRDHWAWKFRDFPLTMLQYAMLPLARIAAGGLELAPYSGAPALGRWLSGAFEATLARQRANGAFDSVGPNTFDHGVTLAMAYALGETAAQLGPRLPPAQRAGLAGALRRAGDFALRSREDYAFISNHHALFACAWRSIFEQTGEARFDAAMQRSLEAIFEQQSREGWYAEYGGADPGYETLGLHYLALLWERTGEVRLLESMRRSTAFLRHCVLPDGSLGGIFGSRHTRLYCPGGLEILAPHDGAAASLARFVRERLAGGGVVTPDSADAHNLAPLLASWVEAERVCAARRAAGAPLPTGPELPCEVADGALGLRRFPESGLCVIAGPGCYGVADGRKGGVLRLLSRAGADMPARLLYEDAGWVARTRRGARWASQHPAGSAAGPADAPTRAGAPAPGAGDGVQGRQLRFDACFVHVRQDVLQPASFVVLRLLNLTLFRSLRLGAWLRRAVIARLITAARPVPLRLERRLEVAEGALLLHDRIETRAGGVAERLVDLHCARSFTAVHMGSARYFHPDELVDAIVTPASSDGTLLGTLRRTGCVDVAVRIPATGTGARASGGDDQ